MHLQREPLSLFLRMLQKALGSSLNNNSCNLPPGPRTIPHLGNLHIMDLKKHLKTIIEGSSLNNNSRNLPPGPRTIPILGNLHMMDLKKPLKRMIEWSKEYGPIFRIKLGFQEMVVLTGYETVKEALVNQGDAFAERASVPFFEDVAKGFEVYLVREERCGSPQPGWKSPPLFPPLQSGSDGSGPVRTLQQGLVFAHGENWKVMRRFTLSTLRMYGMGKRIIEDKITEECSVLIKTIENYSGNPFDVTTILTAAVSNIIVSILFGKRYEYKDNKFQRLLKNNSENFRLSGSPAILLYNLFPKLWFLLLTPKLMIKNQSEIHEFIQTILLEYSQDFDENDQRNFIESFLVRQREENKNTKNDGYFHNENFIVLVDDLFGAGTETMTNTLCWAILLMMKYPEIQSKVQEEIAKEIGDLEPRTDLRAKMPYTDAVIHEVQRFADVVPTNLPHATTMDVTFKGFFIPKGTYILPLLTSVLHDESQWEKPHEFYPEHFLDSKGTFVKRDAFMPFSAGQRVCAGENLAKMELFLFFTSLLQKFTFHPPPGTSKDDLDLTPVVGLTSTPMLYKTCAVLR